MINLVIMIGLIFILQINSALAKPDWQAEVGEVTVKVYKIQSEEPIESSSYDWGACVMKDGDLYRMWWTRPNPPNDKTLPYESTYDDGKIFKYDYPLIGDRIFYAESKDGYSWTLNGTGMEVNPLKYDSDSSHPLMILSPAESKWERKHIACPTVVKVNDVFYMYYEAGGEFKPREGTSPVEYNCSVFLATSKDAKNWTKWPNNKNPVPVVRVPESNLDRDKRRYGFGQPSVCYKNGKFILHYVDSCTWWPDTMIRIESSDPTFRNDVKKINGLDDLKNKESAIPEGAVSKYAMSDICWYGNSFYLVRPIFGTDRVAILRSDSGIFWSDDLSNDPLKTPRQIALCDPRGTEYRARVYPKFLRNIHGELIGDGKRFSIFYGAGKDGPGWTAYTWDIHRADLTFNKPLSKEKKNK